MNTAAIRNDWTGRVIDGRFTLLQWLGSSEDSAVFLTELDGDDSRKAVIKLIPDENGDAEGQIARWTAAKALTHPHLMGLFHAGSYQIDDAPLFYVVSEYAEEDLSQILPERPLTPEETCEMLGPVLEALTCLHGSGFVHGRLRPSNIMVVADKVKLSTDSLQFAGKPDLPILSRSAYDAPERPNQPVSPATDIWSLGITLVEALTQHPPTWDASAQSEPVVPESIPQPLAGIAKECLRLDPRRRCTLTDIQAHLDPARINSARLDPARLDPASLDQASLNPPPLESAQSAPEPPSELRSRAPAKRSPSALIAAGLVVIAVIAVIELRSRPSPQSPPAANPPVAATPAPPSPSPVSERQASNGAMAKGAVADRVLPDLLPSAISSIRGHVAVAVRVTVDSTGNVSNAAFDSAGPSRYFSRMALEAAQHWKFKPAQVNGQAASSIWLLHFQFTQAGTEITPVETSP